MTSTPLVLKAAAVILLVFVALVALVQVLAAKREAAARVEYPPAGRFVDVDGANIHLKTTGQGPDVVLIHGASGSMRDYTFGLAERLSKHYRVTTVDRPGLGWSERPLGYRGVFSLDAEPPQLQARMLQQAVAAVGVRNPIVVGHSFGGAVALAWALEHPAETSALVLLGAASNPWPGSLGPFYRWNAGLLGSALLIPALTAFTPNSVIENTTSSIFAPQIPPDGYLDHFGPEMTLRRDTMRANVQQVNGLRPHIVRMAEQYPMMRLPVEILHGEEDTTVPLDIHSEPLSRMIPNAVLTILGGVGHMPHHAEPDVIVAAIDRAARRAGLR